MKVRNELIRVYRDRQREFVNETIEREPFNFNMINYAEGQLDMLNEIIEDVEMSF